MTQFWMEGTPIKVWAEAGAPKRLVWHETVYPVAEILNHWRIDRGWWRLRVCRDYFKLQTSTGPVLEIFHDEITDKWYLRRLYD